FNFVQCSIVICAFCGSFPPSASGAAPPIEYRSESGDKRGVVKRFIEMGVEACSLCPLVIHAVGQTGHGDDWRVIGSLNAAQLAEEFEPIHAWHPEVA